MHYGLFGLGRFSFEYINKTTNKLKHLIFCFFSLSLLSHIKLSKNLLYIKKKRIVNNIDKQVEHILFVVDIVDMKEFVVNIVHMKEFVVNIDHNTKELVELVVNIDCN